MHATPRLALFSLPLLLAACDRSVPVADAGIEVPANRSLASDSFPPRLLAAGSGPAWSATVEGELLSYATPDARGRHLRAQRRGDVDGLILTGTDGAEAFSLTLRRGKCSDAASGAAGPFVAEFVIGSQSLKGCAREPAQ